MKIATRLLALIVLALLLPLVLTTATRTVRVQRIAEQRTYTYYFPVVAVSSRRGPVPPVRSTSQKKGAGLTHGECADRFGTWGYDWSANPPTCGIEMVPMAWAGVPGTVGGDSQWLIGFNEPDLPEQANLTPALAATLWLQIEERYPDTKLVAPVPSDQHPDWIVQFRDAYIAQFGRPPRFDALAVHCYLPGADLCIALVRRFEAWAQAWGIGEIWVTEFAFYTGGVRTPDQAWVQADQFIAWMEADPMISHYAWFATLIHGDERWSPPAGYSSPLLNGDGSLTYWGLRYAVK